jgi:nicotinate-nucleotide pyrophosphorylase (carboxylating)
LDDAILIKENHLAFYNDITQAIQFARERVSFTCPIEIEVCTTEGAVQAAKAGVDAILLDNMTPEQVSSTVNAIRQLKLASTPLIEVSGKITLDNIHHYVDTGVDVISSGWLTHSAPALDLSLDINPAKQQSSKGG